MILGNIFRQNRYTEWQIRRTFYPLPSVVQPEEKPGSVALLPYVGSIFNDISRVLSGHNTKSVSSLTGKYLLSFGGSRTTWD
jgi:hypothetical protein